MELIFVGILSLKLVLIPVKPSPVFLTNWLVVAYTIKFSESDASFLLRIWFEEKRISPLSEIKCSHVVKKGAA